MFLFTREEITNRELIDLEAYNSVIKNNKIKLANLDNPFLWYDAIDENRKCYEFKQVNHFYGDYDIILCPRSKLQNAIDQNFRTIYHFLNGDMYYIDFDLRYWKSSWLDNPKFPTMVCIPIKKLKPLIKNKCYL
jgi:hypothetical protein